MAKSLKITKDLMRRHKSMKDREHNGQKFEDTPSGIVENTDFGYTV
jgi:hypothetical protein